MKSDKSERNIKGRGEEQFIQDSRKRLQVRRYQALETEEMMNNEINYESLDPPPGNTIHSLRKENIAKDRKVIPDPIDDRKFQE